MVRIIERLIQIIYISFLAGYLYLCFFSYPVADDFLFTQSNNFWIDQINFYNSWSGRYSSTFLLFLGSLVKLDILFQIVPIISIFGLFCIIHSVLRVFKIKDLFLSLFLLVSVLSCFRGLNEAVYWYSGNITYTFSLIIQGILILFCLKNKNSLFNHIIAFFLALALAGMNEINTLYSLIILSATLYYYRDKKLLYSSIFGLLLGLLIILICPGNKIRMSYFPDPNRWNILYKPLLDSFGIFIQVLLSPIVPLCLIISNKISTNFKIDKGLLSILWIAIPFSFIPSILSMGVSPPLRARFMIGIWMAFTFLLTIIYFKKFISLNITKQYFNILLFGCLLLFLSQNSASLISDLIHPKICILSKSLTRNDHVSLYKNI